MWPFKKKKVAHQHKFVYQEKAYKIDKTYMVPKYVGHVFRCDDVECGKISIVRAVPEGVHL